MVEEQTLIQVVAEDQVAEANMEALEVQVIRHQLLLLKEIAVELVSQLAIMAAAAGAVLLRLELLAAQTAALAVTDQRHLYQELQQLILVAVVAVHG
jgi:hypothetical protein